MVFYVLFYGFIKENHPITQTKNIRVPLVLHDELHPFRGQLSKYEFF
jgi:hypothetical protein